MGYAGGAKFEPGSELIIEEDITLYAAWTKDKVSVAITLNPGREKGDEKKINTLEDSSILLPSGDELWPIEEYSFYGWAETEDGTIVHKAGEAYSSSSDVTLHAIWTPNPKITYKANGGVGDDIIEYHKSGEEVTIKNTSFTKNGYSFSYWSTSNTENGTKYEAGSECTLVKDLTLYAIWIEDKDAVTITLNPGNSTGTVVNIDSIEGQKVVLPSGDTFWGSEKYSFSGWGQPKTEQLHIRLEQHVRLRTAPRYMPSGQQIRKSHTRPTEESVTISSNIIRVGKK